MPPSSPPARDGLVTSPVVIVVGAAGGCGVSLAAGGIGLAWARAGRPGALVELDLERGDLAGSWGLPADRTLADLAPVADELAPAHLERAAVPHPSGLVVLLAPGRPGGTVPWDRAAARLLELAARNGPVVVDGGAGASAAVAAALPVATAVLVVAPATLAGARRARRLGAHLAGVGAGDRTGLVVREGPRDALSAKAVGRTAELAVTARLPWAEREADELSAGRWPAGRRRRLAPALAELAEVLG